MRAKNLFVVFVIKDMVPDFLLIDIAYIGKVLFSIKTEMECDQNKWHFLQQVKVRVIKKVLVR